MKMKNEDPSNTKSKLLHAAAKLFLAVGYEKSTVSLIAQTAGVSRGSFCFFFKDKETLLSELVAYVLEGQFKMAREFLAGEEYDEITFYAAETTLQLYMAESSEHIRGLYAASYSLPKTTEIIQSTITQKLTQIFRKHLPHLETKDFYMLEIASGGIMRGFMTVPCDMWFTMEQKVRAFLTTTFRIYEVPNEKIEQTIAFVSRFDYPALAKRTIENMLSYLESKT